MNIPSSFTYTDLDGQPRTVPLVVNEAGYVTPLTAASIAVLPLEQLRKERDRIASRTALSTADWVTLGHLRRQIAVLETPILELEAERDAAIAMRDLVLTQLQPYTDALEHGTGWQQRANTVRHDQLLRKLELAQHRVWAAQDALKARSAAPSRDSEIDGTLPAHLLA